MGTVHPSACTTLKFGLGKAKARERKWGLACGPLRVSTASRSPSAVAKWVKGRVQAWHPFIRPHMGRPLPSWEPCGPASRPP